LWKKYNQSTFAKSNPGAYAETFKYKANKVLKEFYKNSKDTPIEKVNKK
jgi:hypothetical protein